MNDCSKYLKKLYFGGLLFIFIFVIFEVNCFSTLITMVLVIILWILSLIYALPYFRCYGENLRNR